MRTAEPTPAPTQLPTFEPTCVPSLFPTAIPSIIPTAPPTAVPSTATPSALPTFTPTAVPTLKPTKQTSPIIEFSSNVTLTGLTRPEIDSNAEAALVNATATAMAVDASSVTYIESMFEEESDEEDRRALDAHAIDAHSQIPQNNNNNNNNNKKKEKSHSAAGRVLSVSEEYDFFERIAELDAHSYTATSTLKTSVPLDSTDASNATTLYQSLTVLLNDAVADGSFTAQLVKAAAALNASILENAEVSTVTHSSLVVIYLPLSNEEASDTAKDTAEVLLTVGDIVGIVVGMVVLVVFLLGCVACYYYSDKSNARIVSANQLLEKELNFELEEL